MSMEQQPVVYPSPVTNQPSSHSNGSFGTVFVVLAVIVVVSAVACFLGRICSRRRHSGQAKAKQSQAPRPMEREGRQNIHAVGGRGGDIEFGFGKGTPATKPFGNAETKGSRPAAGINGEIRGGGRPRFVDEGDH
ncbi:hypothetical protein U1Q18_017075 [Sarracenia purpurea var. burkii]